MRFMYPWVGCSGGRLAVALLPLGGDEYYVSAAWCSPKDHFQRQRGRQLAAERMGGERYSRRLVVPRGSSWRDFRENLVEAVLETFFSLLPKWVLRDSTVFWQDPGRVFHR